MDDGQQPGERHPARRRYHVLLGDAALDEPLGKLLFERLDAAIGQEIGVEHDDLRPRLRDLQQLIAVCDNQPLGR